MEFFNYDYCIKLNKQNEIDRLNVNINNIKKEIDIKKTHIKTILESYIKYNCIIKFKLLNLKHIIIKFILNINTNKQLIQDNTNKVNSINERINKLNSIKYNYTLYKFNIQQLTNSDDIYINKSNYTICKLLKFYSKDYSLNCSYLKNYSINKNINININILYIFILYCNNNHNLSDNINIFNNIIINLSKLVYKKNKRLYIILNTYLCNEHINTDYINCILYKIVNLYKLFNLNKDIKEFFKIKVKNNIIIKTLYNDKYHLLKNNNNYNNNKIKTNKIVNSKIKLYNKLYLSVYKKHNSMCITINKYEKNIGKLNDLLNIFNNKLITLNNEIEDIDLINCPVELKQKCIKLDNANNICCICLDPISIGIKTSCNHIFHIYCINLYIYYILNNEMNNINILCPLCRNYI